MWHTRAAQPPWVTTPRDDGLRVTGRPSTMERRQRSPRSQTMPPGQRQQQQPQGGGGRRDFRKRAAKPDPMEGKEPYGVEAVQQDINNLEAQAQLLERAGEAAEKKRDFAAAEEHFLEAARLMSEAQALKRRTFTGASKTRTNAHRHRQAHTRAQGGPTQQRWGGQRSNRGRDAAATFARYGASEYAALEHGDEADFDAEEEQEEQEDDTGDEDEVDKLDMKLNRSLGKTLMSHRDMHTRSDIVSADQKLLDVLGWSKGKRERLQDAFRAITSSPHMTFHHFAAFLSTQGVSLKFAVPLFRAFDRRQHGTWLSDGDFLIGVGACARNTPHSGAWLRVRLGFLFRYFSSNGKTMTRDQLRSFIDECCAADPSITLRLPLEQGRTQRVRGVTSMPGRRQEVSPEQLTDHLMAGKHVISQTDFVNLGLNRSLPECSRLGRFNLGA